MGKGGQAEAGAEGKAFDPSLVGAFANACPGCADAACCAPAATPASTPPGSPAREQQKKPRYDKSLKVTTDPVGGKGDPADPTNTEHEWTRCMNGLTEACLRGDGSSQLLTPSFEYASSHRTRCPRAFYRWAVCPIPNLGRRPPHSR